MQQRGSYYLHSICARNKPSEKNKGWAPAAWSDCLLGKKKKKKSFHVSGAAYVEKVTGEFF